MSVLLILLAIITFPLWFGLVAILGFALWMALLWLVGVPISIKVHDKKIGYIRWFKFHQL